MGMLTDVARVYLLTGDDNRNCHLCLLLIVVKTGDYKHFNQEAISVRCFIHGAPYMVYGVVADRVRIRLHILAPNNIFIFCRFDHGVGEETERIIYVSMVFILR